MAKKPRNRKTKKPRKPRSHTRAEGKIYTPSHEVTRSRGAKKPRNRETKKPRKPRSLTEPKAQRPRAHPDQNKKFKNKKIIKINTPPKRSLNLYTPQQTTETVKRKAILHVLRRRAERERVGDLPGLGLQSFMGGCQIRVPF